MGTFDTIVNESWFSSSTSVRSDYAVKKSQDSLRIGPQSEKPTKTANPSIEAADLADSVVPIQASALQV